MQFIRLPNTPLPYDMDKNKVKYFGFLRLININFLSQQATNFKISGTTNTQVGEVHFINLHPLANGQPCSLINPQKYISVELTHSGLRPLSPRFFFSFTFYLYSSSPPVLLLLPSPSPSAPSPNG